jgi:hypothetical protein
MSFSAQNELKILDNTFEPLPIEACTGCGSCLHVPHDRATAGRHLGSAGPEAQLLQPVPHSLKHNVQYPTNDYQILLPSPQNLYIAAVFAVHEGTDRDSLLQCKRDEVNLNAVRQLEAFLWALHKVNAQLLHTVGGLQLGGLLIDTCGSRVRTMMLVAGLDALNNRMKWGGDSHHVLAVVNTLPLQESRAANEILSRLNITSLSTGHTASVIDSSGGRDRYIFQVCVLVTQNMYYVMQHFLTFPNLNVIE